MTASRSSSDSSDSRLFPGLIVLTGPSHAGKTSTAHAISRRVLGPIARLGIDEVISWFDLAPQDPWEAGLPAAYDVAVAATDALLRRGFLVLMESTFTHIRSRPSDSEFHLHELERVVETARERAALLLVVRLEAPVHELQRRRRQTGRMSAEIVAGTWHEHQKALLPVDVTIVDTSAAAPAEVAEAVIRLAEQRPTDE